WETGIAHCRKVMRSNSKLCKDPKGPKQQTCKSLAKHKRNHEAGRNLFLPALLSVGAALLPKRPLRDAQAERQNPQHEGEGFCRPSFAPIIWPWTTSKSRASFTKRRRFSKWTAPSSVAIAATKKLPTLSPACPNRSNNWPKRRRS